MSNFRFYLHGLQWCLNPGPPDYLADVLPPDHAALLKHACLVYYQKKVVVIYQMVKEVDI